MDEPDFHVDGENNAKPHRIEARRLDDGVENRRSHQDDRRRRNEKAADEQEHVDHRHQDPAVDVHLRDALRQRLREVERGEHVAEQDGGGDDHQDHHRLAGRVAQNRPPLFRPPHPVDQQREHDAQRRPDPGGFRRRRHAAIEDIHDADDDGEERRDFGNRSEFLLPGVAEIGGMRAEASLPDDEQRPEHEQAGEHQPR